MKVLVILVLAFASALAAPKEEINPFIVGGVNALPGEFPFIVSIQRTFLGMTNHIAGGAILNNIWVLSAAQVITETPQSGELHAIAGGHNLGLTEEWQARVPVSRHLSILHDGWQAGRRNGPNDIALVRLSVPLTFTPFIRPIRLPVANSVPQGVAKISGWGSTGGSNVNVLQKAILSTITLETCRTAINSLGLNGSFVDDSNLCTGPLTGGISVCTGDNGGPLIQGSAPNEVIVGIASWVITPCGRLGAPSGIYTRVSAYNEWIFSNTGVTH